MGGKKKECQLCHETKNKAIACSQCLNLNCLECINNFVEGSITETFYDYIASTEGSKNIGFYVCHKCDDSRTLPQVLLYTISGTRTSEKKKKEELAIAMDSYGISQKALSYRKRANPETEPAGMLAASHPKVRPRAASAAPLSSTSDKEKEKGESSSQGDEESFRSPRQSPKPSIAGEFSDPESGEEGEEDSELQARKASPTQETGHRGLALPAPGQARQDQAAPSGQSKEVQDPVQVEQEEARRVQAPPGQERGDRQRGDEGKGSPGNPESIPPVAVGGKGTGQIAAVQPPRPVATGVGKGAVSLPAAARNPIPPSAPTVRAVNVGQRQRPPLQSAAQAAAPGQSQSQDPLILFLRLQQEQERIQSAREERERMHRSEMEKERRLREEQREDLRRQQDERTQQMMMRIMEKVVETTKTASAPSTPNAATCTNSNQSYKRKIDIDPKIPKFSGKTEDYAKWWTLFKALVHDQEDISKQIKFYHLEEALKNSSAAHKISGFTFDGGDYDGAIKRLQKFYGNDQQIQDTVWRSLMDLPPVKSDMSNFEEANDKLYGTVSMLKSLGQPAEAINHHCIFWLAKQPKEVVKEVKRQRISRNTDGNAWKMDELLDILDSLVTLYQTNPKEREKKEDLAQQKSKNKGRGNDRKPANDFSMSLVQTKRPGDGNEKKAPPQGGQDKSASVRPYKKPLTANSGSKAPPYCQLCKVEGHYPRACKKYKTPMERRKRAVDEKMCLNCLKLNHELKDCNSHWRCGVCDEKHHTCLHDGKLGSKQIQNVQHAVDTDSDEGSGEGNFPLQLRQTEDGQGAGRQPKMITFPASLLSEDSDEIIQGGVFVDGGGGETFIREKAASQLKLPTIKSKMKRIGRFGDSNIIEFLSRHVPVMVEGPNGHRIKIRAWTIPEPCADLLDLPIHLNKGEKQMIDKYKVLNPPPRRGRKVQIDLLVGKDYEAEFLYASKHPIVSVNKSLVIHLTPFGNILAGATECKTDYCQPIQSLQCTVNSLEDLEKIFQTEGIENESTKQIVRAKDQLLIDKFEAQLEYKDGKYYTGLMWKDGELKLGSNLNAAYRRLAQVVSRLYKNGGENALLEYDKIFRDYLERNIVEVVEKVDVERELSRLKAHLRSGDHSGEECETCLSDNVYYLMHFDVKKDDAVSSKRRVVMDGSQAVQPNKKSLNETQEKGPNSLQSLPGVIHRTRTADGGLLVADAEKMYLSVRLKEEEKNRNRVLWLKDPTNPNLSNNIIVLRYLVVVFGLICSSFILQQVFRIHLKRMGGSMAERLEQSAYVDNFCIGLRKGEDFNTVYKDTKELFARGGFNLRHWASSNQEFNQAILEQQDVHPDLIKEKIGFLGLIYDTDGDHYSLKQQKVPLVNGSLPMATTKREVVRLVAKFGYDPIGYTLPVLMKARIFIQQLWIDRSDWDEKIHLERTEEMDKILHSLLRLCEVKIARLILQDLDLSVHIIIISDASERALAAGVYVWQKVNESISSHLATAQGKVASLKPLRTIVQLELNAMLMGVRLAKSFMDETKVKVEAVHIFSDSEIILHQCLTDKKLPKYSQVRVDEVMSITPILHHVEGKKNVSDGPSRGLLFDEVNWKDWLHGPQFIREGTPADWEEFKNSMEKEDENEELIQMTSIITPAESEKSPSTDKSRLDICNYSSLNKLLNIRAWCRRWIKKGNERKALKFITAQERKSELKSLIRNEQEKEFKKEIEDLTKGKKTNLSKQMDLLLDKDGLLRRGGRICYPGMSLEKAHPLLLPQNSPLSDLIILQEHTQVGHQKIKATLAQIRRRYWIPGGESKISRVLKTCPDCLKVKGGHLKPPRFGSLPVERLKAERAFQFTGLDHTGEIEVRMGDGGLTAVYILLFTCLVTRAVSLTWTATTSAKDTIMAIRRFCAIRGTPEIIYSDQATGYIKAKEELRNEAKIGEHLSNKMIEWRLQTPKSPWTSGVWERLQGSMKKILRHSLWRRKVSLTELETFLAETEGILNSRPLCELSGDDESGEVLTPAHFLAPSTQLNMPYNYDNLEDPDFNVQSNKHNLQKAFKINKTMIKLAWESFQRDYLSFLRSSQRSHHKASKGELPWKPRVGSVYLVYEENKSRQQWKRCKVLRLLESADGATRFVQVQLPSGHVTQRGIKDLYPLEAQIEEDFKDIQHRCPEKKVRKDEKSNDSSDKKEMKTSRYNLRPRLSTVQQQNAQTLAKRGMNKLFFLGCIAICLVNPVCGKETSYQICLSGPGGRVLQMPESIDDCDFHQPRYEQRETSATLYVPKSEFASIEAVMCYVETTVVCTSYSFFGGSGLVQPPITSRKPVSRAICMDSNKTGIFNGTELVQKHTLPSHRTTNRTLEVEYKWLTSRHCSSVSNMILEEGTVSTLDGKNVISSLDNVNDCHIGAGHCEITDATIIWSQDELPEILCEYEDKGEYSMTINGDLGVIHSLQSAFHFRQIPAPACLLHNGTSGLLNGTAEGVFLRLNEERTLRHRREYRRRGEDPVNVKLNYFANLIQEKLEPVFLQTHQLFCKLARRDLEIKLMMARIDPTVGTRALLNREDVSGEWDGDKLIIHLCHKANVTKIFENYKFNEFCYKMRPVTVAGLNQIWFEAPSGRDLVPFSPKVSCHLVNEKRPEGNVALEQGIHPQYTWNLKMEPMVAPPLFKSHTHYPASVLRILAAHTGPMEARLHGTIIYSSKLADDSPSFIHLMEEAGKFVGEIQQRQLQMLGGVLESGVEATGKVVNALSSPLTKLLYSLAAAAFGILLLIGLGFFIYMRCLRPTSPTHPPLTLHSKPKSKGLISSIRRRATKDKLLQQPAKDEDEEESAL